MVSLAQNSVPSVKGRTEKRRQLLNGRDERASVWSQDMTISSDSAIAEW
ncbi:hypothetical protein ACU8KH_06020 [Lachancea thermotolerans]